MSEPKDLTSKSKKAMPAGSDPAVIVKKAYVRPSLRRLGTVQELTHSGGTNIK